MRAKKRIRTEPIIVPNIGDDPRFVLNAICVECGNKMRANWLCRGCFDYDPDGRYVTKICRDCHERATHKRTLDIHSGKGSRQSPMHTSGIEYDPDAFKKAIHSA